MQGVGTGTIEANQLLGDSNPLKMFLILLSRGPARLEIRNIANFYAKIPFPQKCSRYTWHITGGGNLTKLTGTVFSPHWYCPKLNVDVNFIFVMSLQNYSRIWIQNRRCYCCALQDRLLLMYSWWRPPAMIVLVGIPWHHSILFLIHIHLFWLT